MLLAQSADTNFMKFSSFKKQKAAAIKIRRITIMIINVDHENCYIDL